MNREQENHSLEQKARKHKTCLACGSQKTKNALLCWNCFKDGDFPYKHSCLNLNDWILKKRIESKIIN